MNNQQKRLAKRGGRRKANPAGAFHPRLSSTPLAVVRINSRQLKIAKQAILLARKQSQNQAKLKAAQKTADPDDDAPVIVAATNMPTV